MTVVTFVLEVMSVAWCGCDALSDGCDALSAGAGGVGGRGY